MRLSGVSIRDPLPSHTSIILHTLFAAVVNDLIFYWAHRALHTPQLYHIHKMHHEHKAPFALTSEYASLFEFLVVDATPLMIGPLIASTHLFTIWIWITIRLLYTLDIHSGIDLGNVALNVASL